LIGKEPLVRTTVTVDDGQGIGYVDVHLLASTALTEDTTLWTRDKRLQIAAQALRLSHPNTGAH
jgi:predicted nucleic acid-binding protein